MRIAIGAVTAVVVLVASTAAARADDLHVPRDFRRLQAALDAAKPGDRVLVDRGAWKGTFEIRTSGIEVVAGPKARLVAAASRAGFWRPVLDIRADDVAIRGFTVQKGWITAEGDGIVIEGNTFKRFANADSYGGFLRIDGDRAVVASNTILRDSRTPVGISVWGNDATVVGNRIESRLMEEAIHVLGDAGTVESNEVVMTAEGTGIRVGPGPGHTVTGNTVSGAPLLVFGDGSVVRGNTVRDAGLGQASILADGNDMAILDNGSADGLDTGLLVRGDGNLVQENDVSGVGTAMTGETVGHGIVVRGSANLLVSDVVEGCCGEAFRVVGNDRTELVMDPDTGAWFWKRSCLGPGNDVVACIGTGAGTCGLGNWTLGTGVTDSVFVDNGVDVVSGEDFDVFDGNTWQSGGPDFEGTGQGRFTDDTWTPFFVGGD